MSFNDEKQSGRCFRIWNISMTLHSHLPVSFYLDGNFLAIGSHDNYIYIYAVAENGRKYGRVGKCSVSAFIYSPYLSAALHILCPLTSNRNFIFSLRLTPYIWFPWPCPCPPRVPSSQYVC